MHIAVVIIYDLLVAKGEGLGFIAIVAGIYYSINDFNLDTWAAIVANCVCIIPMIIASWKAAERDSAKLKNTKEYARQ